MARKDIQFFGSVDRKGKVDSGKVTSAYPAWYFTTHLEDLKEGIDRKHRAIQRGEIPASELDLAKIALKKETERYENIMMSRPKLDGKDVDDLAKVYKELEKDIQDSLFTRSDMKKGLVDVHEEARRMSEPIINVGGNVELLREMGVNIPKEHKMVSRNQASKAYKILGKLLGENTNVERLRRDYATGTHRQEIPLEELR